MGRQLRSAQRSVDGKNWVAMLRKCKQKIRAYSVKRKKNRKTFDFAIIESYFTFNIWDMANVRAKDMLPWKPSSLNQNSEVEIAF